ncbi:hypothetical protein KM043_014261 [Ampulex compressa]|nr:hypothetical protein KM043_014261 [Ampulex compressa]
MDDLVPTFYSFFEDTKPVFSQVQASAASVASSRSEFVSNFPLTRLVQFATRRLQIPRSIAATLRTSCSSVPCNLLKICTAPFPRFEASSSSNFSAASAASVAAKHGCGPSLTRHSPVQFDSWKMLVLSEDTLITNWRGTLSSKTIWLYLSVEFLIGGIIFAFIATLSIIKSLLPKPPRDLTGDIVLVAGVSSSLGESLAKNFAAVGCTIVCIDNDVRSAEKIASELRSQYPRVEEIRSRHRKNNERTPQPRMLAYGCDLTNGDELREIARKVKEDVGKIDVLVTCVGSPDQDIFDSAYTTLMSHYWTVMAFFPAMTHRDRAYVVGVTPVVYDQDAYMSSKMAIASLMESLGHDLDTEDSELIFLSVAPVVKQRLTRECEEEIAGDIVQAVRRNQCSLSVSRISRFAYHLSCCIYNAITRFEQWLHAQGCDYGFST